MDPAGSSLGLNDIKEAGGLRSPPFLYRIHMSNHINDRIIVRILGATTALLTGIFIAEKFIYGSILGIELTIILLIMENILTKRIDHEKIERNSRNSFKVYRKR